jgi:hypothetical protein
VEAGEHLRVGSGYTCRGLCHAFTVWVLPYGKKDFANGSFDSRKIYAADLKLVRGASVGIP